MVPITFLWDNYFERDDGLTAKYYVTPPYGGLGHERVNHDLYKANVNHEGLKFLNRPQNSQF